MSINEHSTHKVNWTITNHLCRRLTPKPRIGQLGPVGFRAEGLDAPGPHVVGKVRDKKVRDGQVRFVLPTGIGSVEIRNDVSASTVVEALQRT